MEISPILSSLIHAEFNTTHMKDENLEKAYFCVDCGGKSLSRRDMEAKHGEHKVFRPKKTSHHYSYTKVDILSLGLDVAGICVYNINSTDVYFPKSRSLEKHHVLKGNLGSCFTCGFPIKKPALFCSILCKLECNEDEEELKTMRRIMEQEHVGVSLKKRKCNKKGKGVDEKVGCDDGVSLNIMLKGNAGISKEKKKLESLFDVVEGKSCAVGADSAKKVSYRLKSRKGVPRRAPFF